MLYTDRMIEIAIPGTNRLQLQHLVLDVNGTIAKDGQLIEGVTELLAALRTNIDLHLVTADTHGRQETIDRILKLAAIRIPPQNQAQAKLCYIEQLGAEGIAAIGNGANDAAMLERAALGILVVGPEGAAVESLLKAKVVVSDIRAALELLLFPNRLIATLRR
jgi:soluble P-type ATPase